MIYHDLSMVFRYFVMIFHSYKSWLIMIWPWQVSNNKNDQIMMSDHEKSSQIMIMNPQRWWCSLGGLVTITINRDLIMICWSFFMTDHDQKSWFIMIRSISIRNQLGWVCNESVHEYMKKVEKKIPQSSKSKYHFF